MDELVRALREHPDDRATWLVYADTLGDDPRAHAIVEGIDAPQTGIPERFVAGRRYGFVTALDVPADRGALIEFALARPDAKLVGTLTLRPGGHYDDSEAWDGDIDRLPARDVTEIDLSQIHHIGICYHHITWELPALGPLELLTRLRLGRLRSIDLRYDNLDDAAIEELLPLCAGVETLRLQHNRITERGARMLAALPDLKLIDLRYNAIRGAAEAFAGKKLHLNAADR